MVTADDGNGHSVAIDTASSTNYAAPSSVTPMNNPAWAGGYGYDAALNLAQATGPNGSTESAVYNVSRPTQTTGPDWAVTTYDYHDASPAWRKATINGRWTKTWVDGFGRTTKVETGDGAPSSPVTKSVVDTEYAPCACSPLGKLYRTSRPYAPGGAVYWTTYSYDALGRTVSIAHPNGTGTTTYSYQGNTVTVTDPTGKWKTYTLDVFGNIKQVTEPRPAGGTHDTLYTYDGLNHLTNVSMTRDGVTQTRTFVYDPATQRLSSATNPENGAVTYTYNADGTLWKKTDARNQRVEYSYDTNGRLAVVRRFLSNNTEDPCQAVTYYYDTSPRDATFTQNGQGRVTVVEWGGQTCSGLAFANWYCYAASGHITKKRLRQTRWIECCDGGYQVETFDLDDTASYDNEGRMSTHGPDTYAYDALGRPNRLTRHMTVYDPGCDCSVWQDIDVVKDVLYGPAGELTQIKMANGLLGQSYSYLTETRQYNARLQLTRQTVAGVMDMEYRYPAQNNGRITQSKDYITGEEVTYTYDSLQRLISAMTTGPEWGQSFTYDGFGNLLNQTVTKGSAPSMSLLVSGTNNRITSAGFGYDPNGNLTTAPGMTMTYDVENRLASAGGEQYAYGPDNRRVWKRLANGAEEISFYGIGGEKLTGPHSYEYFAGRLIRMDNQVVWRDRLGSVRANGSTRMSYFPYGGERTVTGNGTEKFGTYYRDATGLDYANQRYYASMWGRFNTADPYKASGGPGDPGSWNRYAYVEGDPLNFRDRHGLSRYAVVGGEGDDDDDDDDDDSGDGDMQHPRPARCFGPCPSGGSGGSGGSSRTGRGNAAAGLATISRKGFKSRPDCNGFFEKLIDQNDLDVDADTLMNKLAEVAGVAVDFVYDGPSSPTTLDADKFPNTASPGVTTVGQWFAVDSNRSALSQFNGAAIFVRTGDWSGWFSQYIDDGQVNQYGMGSLMHELLHKQIVGGGFKHDQIRDALKAAGRNTVDFSGQNGLSRELGKICF